MERRDRRGVCYCAAVLDWEASRWVVPRQEWFWFALWRRGIVGGASVVGILLGAVVLFRRGVYQGLYETLWVGIEKDAGKQGGAVLKTGGQRNRVGWSGRS